MNLKKTGKLFKRVKKEDKQQPGQQLENPGNNSDEQMNHLMEMIGCYHNLKKLNKS